MRGPLDDSRESSAEVGSADNTTKVSDAVEYIILSGGILGWDEGDIRNATLPINEKIAYVRVWTQ
jgi:hypothetical protein